MPELLTQEPYRGGQRPPSNRNGGRLQPRTMAGFKSENPAQLNWEFTGSLAKSICITNNSDARSICK